MYKDQLNGSLNMWSYAIMYKVQRNGTLNN